MSRKDSAAYQAWGSPAAAVAAGLAALNEAANADDETATSTALVGCGIMLSAIADNLERIADQLEDVCEAGRLRVTRDDRP